MLLAIDNLREKKKRPGIFTITDFLQKTEARASDLIERAINELIEQKSLVHKKTQKGNDSFFDSEFPSEPETENRQ